MARRWPVPCSCRAASASAQGYPQKIRLAALRAPSVPSRTGALPPRKPRDGSIVSLAVVAYKGPAPKRVASVR